MLIDLKYLDLAYHRQRGAALHRGIEWKFDFDSWATWWINSGYLPVRGKSRDEYQMCRFNDCGPYSPDNVYCATGDKNIEDFLTHNGGPWNVGKEASSEAKRKMSEARMGISPYNKGVSATESGTPYGEAHHKAVLNADLVRSIRTDARPNTVIARECGVSSAMIGYVKKRHSWKHVI